MDKNEFWAKESNETVMEDIQLSLRFIENSGFSCLKKNPHMNIIGI